MKLNQFWSRLLGAKSSPQPVTDESKFCKDSMSVDESSNVDAGRCMDSAEHDLMQDPVEFTRDRDFRRDTIVPDLGPLPTSMTVEHSTTYHSQHDTKDSHGVTSDEVVDSFSMEGWQGEDDLRVSQILVGQQGPGEVYENYSSFQGESSPSTDPDSVDADYYEINVESENGSAQDHVAEKEVSEGHGSEEEEAVIQTAPEISSPELRDKAMRLLEVDQIVEHLEHQISKLIVENTKLKQLLEESGGRDAVEKNTFVLEQKLSKLRCDFQKERSTRGVVETEVIELEKALAAKQAEIHGLHSFITENTNFANEAQAASQMHKAKSEQMWVQNRELIEEVESLKARLESAKEDYHQSQSEVQDQKSLIDELKTAMEERERISNGIDDSMELKASLSLSRKETAILQSKIEDMSHLQKRCEDVEQQLSASKIALAQTEESSKQVSDELQNYREKCTNLVTDLQCATEAALRWSILAEQNNSGIPETGSEPRVLKKEEMEEGQKFFLDVVAKLRVQRSQQTPLVKMLSQRLESIIVERSRNRVLTDDLRREISSQAEYIKLIELQLQEARSSDKPTEDIKELQAKCEELQNEKDVLLNQFHQELSFCEPADCASETSTSPFKNAERLLPMLEDQQNEIRHLETLLREKQQQVSSLLGKDSGVCSTCAENRNHCVAIVSKDKEIAQLRSKHKEEYLQALSIFGAHIDQLQELLKHEALVNAELRTILDTNNEAATGRISSLKAQISSMSDRINQAEFSKAATVTWLRKALRSFSGLSIPCSIGLEDLKSKADELIDSYVREAEDIRMKVKKLEPMESCIANLRLQKRAILHIYATRGEQPVGVAWKSERATEPLTRLRSCVSTVVAAVKLRLMVESRVSQVPAIDPSKYFCSTMPPVVWQKWSTDVSPCTAMALLPSLQAGLEQNKSQILELQEQLAASELSMLGRQSETFYEDTFNILLEQKENITKLLGEEKKRFFEKEEHLQNRLREAEESVVQAEANAAGEREARHLAESKVRKYVRQLEHYSSALSKAKAENLVRSKTIVNAISRIQDVQQMSTQKSELNRSRSSAELQSGTGKENMSLLASKLEKGERGRTPERPLSSFSKNIDF
ncbi:hypothetical protein NDN08_006682 [Rhodosorus marinus]|uniref:Pericentrin/AKAP-450 centrosomal targeting domain-containing protein n=1 Tax=Rhodosorus marinus TaxID=101924 RepID=A0AAV8UID0_9RHOD|nr:hypothetical protein NDN08_006682 [Rhodosorus marinus]